MDMPRRPRFDAAQILEAAKSAGILGAGAQTGFGLVAALFDPIMTVDGLAALVSTEAVICARVLRVANSPFYGQRRRVTTVDHAFVILGFDAIRGIAAAVCLDRSLTPMAIDRPVDVQALLHHSVATAAAAESLGRLRRPDLASHAFVAGLLHNLGILVQAQLDPHGVGAMIESGRSDPGFDIRSLESQHAAVGHEECVASIFESWQLPTGLAEAARHHHNPAEATEAHRDLAILVGLGAQLAARSGSGSLLEPRHAHWVGTASEALRLTEQHMAQVADELPERVADLRATVTGA